MLDKMRELGVDGQGLLDYYVSTYRTVLRDLPSDMVKGMCVHAQPILVFDLG